MIRHPGVDVRANLKSICHRCHLFEVAFVWELIKKPSICPWVASRVACTTEISAREKDLLYLVRERGGLT